MRPVRKILLKYKSLGFIDNYEEVAELLDTSPRRVGYVFQQDDRRLYDDELLVLQRHFAGLGRMELAGLSIPEGYELVRSIPKRIDGSTLDEIRDMIREMGEAETDKENGDIDGAIENAAELREVVDRYICELKAMKS